MEIKVRWTPPRPIEPQAISRLVGADLKNWQVGGELKEGTEISFQFIKFKAANLAKGLPSADTIVEMLLRQHGILSEIIINGASLATYFLALIEKSQKMNGQIELLTQLVTDAIDGDAIREIFRN